MFPVCEHFPKIDLAFYDFLCIHERYSEKVALSWFKLSKKGVVLTIWMQICNQWTHLSNGNKIRDKIDYIRNWLFDKSSVNCALLIIFKGRSCEIVCIWLQFCVCHRSKYIHIYYCRPTNFKLIDAQIVYIR